MNVTTFHTLLAIMLVMDVIKMVIIGDDNNDNIHSLHNEIHSIYYAVELRKFGGPFKRFSS